MQWALYANGSYDTVVSYVLTAGNGAGSGNGPSKYLTRQICTSGASTTPNSTFVASHDAGTPTVTFNPVAFLGANASWKSTQGLYGVKLTTTAAGSNYQYTLSGLPSASTSTGSVSTITQTPNPAGCNLASPGSGVYANVLCFVDLTSFTDPATSCQQMKLSIANSPDYLQFCVIETPTDTAAPQQVPTYYGFTDGGWDSEAYLGNNGFYTGIAGLPALSQRQQTSLNTPTWPNGFGGGIVWIHHDDLLFYSGGKCCLRTSHGLDAGYGGCRIDGHQRVAGIPQIQVSSGTLLPNSSTSMWGNS